MTEPCPGDQMRARRGDGPSLKSPKLGIGSHLVPIVARERRASSGEEARHSRRHDGTTTPLPAAPMATMANANTGRMEDGYPGTTVTKGTGLNGIMPVCRRRNRTTWRHVSLEAEPRVATAPRRRGAAAAGRDVVVS
eukprot:gene14028-biopygen10017